jgi:hypothetical protein
MPADAFLANDTISNAKFHHRSFLIFKLFEYFDHGERKTSWKEFLRQHWDLIVAADFFTLEAWTRRGLQWSIAKR